MPKTDPKRHSELIAGNWVQLREPQNILAIVTAAVSIMALSALLTLKILGIFSPFTLADFGITPSQTISLNIDLKALAGLIGLLLGHELLHLAFIPNFARSEKTYFGITYFGGFVYSEEVLSKPRYIIITIAPFVIISIILPLMLGILGLLTPTAKFLVLLNSVASCMDIMNLGLVLVQAPKGAHITGNSMRTYWKKDENALGEV